MVLLISGSGFVEGDLTALVGSTPATEVKVIADNVACARFEANIPPGKHDLVLRSSTGSTTAGESIVVSEPASPAQRVTQGIATLQQMMEATLFAMCMVERDGMLAMDAAQSFEELNEAFDKMEPALSAIEEEALFGFSSFVTDQGAFLSPDQEDELLERARRYRSFTPAEKQATMIRAHEVNVVVNNRLHGSGKAMKPFTPKDQAWWEKKVGHTNPDEKKCKDKRKYYVFIGDVHDLNKEEEAEVAGKLIKMFQKKDKTACVFLVAGTAATKQKLIDVLKDPTTDGLGYTGHSERVSERAGTLAGLQLHDPKSKAPNPVEAVSPTQVAIDAPRLKNQKLRCAILLACNSGRSDGTNNDFSSVLTGRKNFFGFQQGCTSVQGSRVMDDMLAACNVHVAEETLFEAFLREQRQQSTEIWDAARKLFGR